MEESVKESVNNVLESVKKYVHKGHSGSNATDSLRTDEADRKPRDIDASHLSQTLNDSDNKTDAEAGGDHDIKAYHQSVSNIVIASHQMLNFAACAGKEIDDDISHTITEFSHKVINREDWSPAEETQFLTSSSTLARSLLPVTYDTLQSSTNNRADRFVKLFGLLTVTLLIFLVCAQSFWVIIDNATQTIDIKQNDMLTASMNVEMLAKQNLILNDQLALMPSKKGGQDANEEKRQSLHEKIFSNEEAIALNTRKYNQAEDLLNSSAKILAYWLPFQKSIETGKQDNNYKNTLLTTWAKQILQGMSAYLLPLVYGLVGACAFVLRALSRQIRERTFSSTDSVIQFGLRLVLGALAGISIGWFLKPEISADSLVSSLSPLALAFIAGYSVELVFTAVDKIISAFTGSGPGESKSASAT